MLKLILMLIATTMLSLHPLVAYSTNNRVLVIVPFGPGGGSDGIFRRLQKFGEKENVELIPLYKPGAQGQIGLRDLYNAPTDGSYAGIVTFDVLAMAPMSIDYNNVLPLQKTTFGIVVSADSPHSLKQLALSATYEKPLKIGYLIPIQKAIMVRTMEILSVPSDRTIFVPYKKGGEMVHNVLGKDIDIGITTLGALAPLIKAGSLNLLAVNSSSPVTHFPEAPLLQGISGFGNGASLVLPPNTPGSVRKFWTEFIKKYHVDEDVIMDQQESYWQPLSQGPSETEKTIQRLKLILQQESKSKQ